MKNQKLEIITSEEREIEGKIENGVITIYLSPEYEEFKKIIVSIRGKK